MSDEKTAENTTKGGTPPQHHQGPLGGFSFRRKLDEKSAPFATQPIRRYDIWTIFTDELPVLWNETDGSGQRVTYEAWVGRVAASQRR